MWMSPFVSAGGDLVDGALRGAPHVAVGDHEDLGVGSFDATSDSVGLDPGVVVIELAQDYRPLPLPGAPLKRGRPELAARTPWDDDGYSRQRM